MTSFHHRAPGFASAARARIALYTYTAYIDPLSLIFLSTVPPKPRSERRRTTRAQAGPLPHAPVISFTSVVCLLPPNVAQLYRRLFRAWLGNEVRPRPSRLVLRLALCPLFDHTSWRVNDTRRCTHAAAGIGLELERRTSVLRQSDGGQTPSEGLSGTEVANAKRGQRGHLMRWCMCLCANMR